MPSSLEGSLSALLHDPLGRGLLAGLDVEAAAAVLSDDDLYGDRQRLAQAAALAGADVTEWYRHRLWCAQRDALAERAKPLEIAVHGTEYLAETAGWATILVSPMTVRLADALSVIRVIAEGRRVIVYGHEVFAEDIADTAIEVADPHRQTRAHIISVLDAGGLYCTYGDFAYADLPVRMVRMFGQPRPMSAGWVRLAARDGTMLLPTLCRRTADNRLDVDISEPIRIESGPTPSLSDLEGLAAILAELLEEQIRLAPAQWLLLPTLSFESPEMASVPITS